jgi:predicted Holliday junction resolvase-like endonuclease
MEIELTLVWAILVTITLGIIIVFLVKLKKTHDQDIFHKEDEIQELNKKLDSKQKRSYQMGVNTTSGDYTQILGDFALLSKYDQIITLSTTSKAPSLDLIGINEESLDFLEIKKKGAKPSKNENHLRRLVEEKKVSYKIFDIDLPDSFTLEERELKELRKKK